MAGSWLDIPWRWQTMTGKSRGGPDLRAQRNDQSRSKARRRLVLKCTAGALGVAALTGASAAWVAHRADEVKRDLTTVSDMVPKLKRELLAGDGSAAEATVRSMQQRTSSAKEATTDPLWKAAEVVPWIGANFTATAEVAVSADDVATHAALPLVTALDSLDWTTLSPSGGKIQLKPLHDASSGVVGASRTVELSYRRLASIDTAPLLPDVAKPITRAVEDLATLKDALAASADASRLLPSMLGADGTRNYLLLIQNSAETRATGGIPGALAILTADDGKLTLGTQSSAGEIGVFDPAIPVDSQQQLLYSGRLGKFMQDVNLTPDYPTAASTAQAMWAKRFGQRVDGVISMDPVALSYVLRATGPVELQDPDSKGLAAGGLPTRLTGENVVRTLLSDVYAEIAQPTLQDAYFAAVAKEIFAGFSSGKSDTKRLIDGLVRGVDERRIQIWSSSGEEQSVISKYPLSGSMSGPSVAAAQFGVYFNDGTGAKMDYYVKRTAHLVQECTNDGYAQVKVVVKSTNTAPLDAAQSLPSYVTGGGIHGVSPGSVQTNIVVYGPTQANVETATQNGVRIPFGAQRDGERPIGTVTQVLKPGQTSTLELTFGKIVQHAAPSLVVTPSVQPVKDVILGTKAASCLPSE